MNRNPKSAPEEQPVKKGKPTWRPAQKLDVKHKSKNFRYRWAWVDNMNIEAKLSEGWVFVNKETGIPGEHEHPGDGKPLDSAKTYRELVLMALPEELAQARDEWVNERIRRQDITMKGDLKRKISEKAQELGADEAKTYGVDTIE